MARVDIDKITPQFISALFQQLPHATRNALGQMGSPTDWARSIRNAFTNESSLPAGFWRMEPSRQLEIAIAQHLTAGGVSLAGVSADTKAASGRLAQLLSVGAVDRRDSEKIESLIADATAQQATAAPTGNQAQNSLQKQVDVNF